MIHIWRILPIVDASCTEQWLLCIRLCGGVRGWEVDEVADGIEIIDCWQVLSEGQVKSMT